VLEGPRVCVRCHGSQLIDPLTAMKHQEAPTLASKAAQKSLLVCRLLNMA
jgi:hypothetical protein